jgi:ElaB/YqjD/DUF883 family membrane-anchored ribosome-binding protein
MSDTETTRQDAETTPQDTETTPQEKPEEIRRDVEQTRSELGETVEALSRKTDVKARFGEKVGATSEDAKRAASRVARTAEERPAPAIGVAFGAGVLLGWLIGRS